MNEKKMREDYMKWKMSDPTTISSDWPWEAWQAACANKQKEIDALQYAYQLDEELIGAIQKIITVLNNRPTSDDNS